VFARGAVGSQRQNANDFCAAIRIGSNRQNAPNGVDAVFHDPQSYSRLPPRRRAEAAAIILDAETELDRVSGEMNINPPGLPMFDGKELAHFVELASWVTVNDYEARMLSDRTGLSCAEMSRQVQGVVVTLGAEGCEVWIDGEKTLVPPVKAETVVDPTGCGDAFRGALLYGLEQGWSLARCAALGNRIGAHKIATRGGQNYTLSAAQISG